MLYGIDRISLIGLLYSIFFLFFDKDIHIIQQASRAKPTDITKYKKGLEDVDKEDEYGITEENFNTYDK